MDRTDWLLLFLADPKRQGARWRPRSLEPLRIMKGMFLASMRGRGELRGLYSFRPYDYGPFTPHVYEDLNELAAEGYIVQEAVAGRSWRTYRPTRDGIERASKLAEHVDKHDAEVLDEAYEFVTKRGFLPLLRELYAAYPEYAVNTIVKDAAPRTQ